MRSLRSFEVEPWLKSAGQQVWTRIRRGLGAQEQELQESLRREVELLGEVRTNVQRATQLARVLDAVYAIAEAHEFTAAQLAALREARPVSKVESVMELARKLETRAVQVIEQMWGGEVAQDKAPARAAHTELKGSVRQAGSPGYAVRGAGTAVVVPPLSAAGMSDSVLSWLRSDMSADLRFARAGMDAARATLQVSSNELSLRLRITRQTALDAVQWVSRRRRNELALWLLSRDARLVIRKVGLLELARSNAGSQLLLRVALASGATGTAPFIARLPRRLRAGVTSR